jgi:hypothetical protein
MIPRRIIGVGFDMPFEASHCSDEIASCDELGSLCDNLFIVHGNSSEWLSAAFWL